MESLTNACHRSVLFSIMNVSKDAPKIAEELEHLIICCLQNISKIRRINF